MPEDLLIGSRFETARGGNIANQNAVENASVRLVWEDGTFPAFDHFRENDPKANAREVVQSLIKGGGVDPQDPAEPAWEDNVPPSIDDFGF